MEILDILTEGSIVYSNWFMVIASFLVLWDLTWKRLALWRAGRKNEPVWFVFLLILNTLGILPIVYLIISKDKKNKKEKVIATAKKRKK